MTRKHLLILFTAAGLILGLAAGIWTWRLNRGLSAEDITGCITDFTAKIAAGDLQGARNLMTEETGSLLRDPGNSLGEVMYRKLSLKSVDHVMAENGDIYSADVILTSPDRVKIAAKAGILFGERVTAEGPAEDTDRMMAEIYEELLSRDDLPMLDSFCVIRVENRNGKPLIRGDETLQRILENGN